MQRKNTYLIHIFLLFLCCLCGCFNLLSTQERQACLAITHYASTDIPSCNTQNKCMEETPTIYFSEHLTKEIHNELLIYKNNLASAIVYFNKSKDTIDYINTGCEKWKDANDMVDKSNDLFFYISNIFTFIDKSTTNSIILLKDYAIYLQSQNIDKIAEEEIYNDYILINDNLNELKATSNNKTYTKDLKTEIEQLHKIAEELGFKQTYLANITFFDLMAYYLNVSTQASSDAVVPVITPSITYAFGKFSNITTLKKININLEKADNYNLYLTLDRIIGNKNSLSTQFITITNKINTDLDTIYNKITNLEKYIYDNQNYLDEQTKQKYLNSKYLFEYKNLTFGEYLATLKDINIDIEKNKIEEINLNEKITQETTECNNIIENAKEKNNIYLNYLIENYEKENNNLNKKEICDQIKNNLNISDCVNKLDQLQKTGLFEELNGIYIKEIDDNKCQSIINNLNYKLEHYTKIKLLKELITKNKKIIYELESVIDNDDYLNIQEIISHNEKIKKIEKETNIDKILDIDKKIQEQTDIYTALIELCKIQENKHIQNNYEITYLNGEYYLKIKNLFSFELNDITIAPDIKYNELEINGNEIIKKTNKLVITTLYPGENYYKITYTNKKEITTKIISLGLNECLLETTIKNQVIGIKDHIYIGEYIQLISKEVDINGEEITYITQKENKIYYTKKLLEKTNLLQNIENLNKERYIIKEKFIIKNNYEKQITGEIDIYQLNLQDTFILKENNKTKDAINVEGDIRINIEINPNEAKTYEIQILKNTDDIINEINQTIAEITRLQNSRFKEIQNLTNEYFKESKNIQWKEQYTIEEIKQIYNYQPKIEEIKTLEQKLETIEEQYFITLEELNKMNLSTEDKQEINEIDEIKYNNIQEAYNKILNIKLKQEANKEQKIEETKQNIDKNIVYYKNILEEYDLNSPETNKLINELIEKKEETLIPEIDKKINEEIEKNAKRIYSEIIQIMEELDVKEINELIEKVYYIFEEYTLQEIYDINYFPPITTTDAERLEKKIKFLDTATLDNELTELKEAYSKKEYLKIIDAISPETTTRLKEIYEEKNLLEKGYNQIKKDAQQTIDKKIEENKIYKNKEIDTLIENAKEEYNKGKYLTAISLLSNATVKEPQKNQKNIQIATVGIILCIFLIMYFFFRADNSKKKKKIDYQEKRMKVIRHT